MLESLNRAIYCIKPVSDEAETEWQAEIEKLKQHVREVMAATGKNIRPNLKGVQWLMGACEPHPPPTLNVLAKATTEGFCTADSGCDIDINVDTCSTLVSSSLFIFFTAI